MNKVYIKTLGCKVNTFDSRVLENQFRAKGYEILSTPENADIQVINSCSVTSNAEKEARYLLRRFKRENPKSLNVITGCYAQIHSASLKDMEEVDFVVPNEVKNDLIPLLENKIKGTDLKLPSEVKAVRENLEQVGDRAIPAWLDVDKQHLRGKIKRFPQREDIQFQVNEQLVVELYSR